MWIITSMIVWALVPNLTLLYSLAVGACVTPTDPVLSATIVRGKFADKHLPKPLQNIIIAGSGANDGLGYPFLFLPLYLITFIGPGERGHTASNQWFSKESRISRSMRPRYTFSSYELFQPITEHIVTR